MFVWVKRTWRALFGPLNPNVPVCLKCADLESGRFHRQVTESESDRTCARCGQPCGENFFLTFAPEDEPAPEKN